MFQWYTLVEKPYIHLTFFSNKNQNWTLLLLTLCSPFPSPEGSNKGYAKKNSRHPRWRCQQRLCHRSRQWGPGCRPPSPDGNTRPALIGSNSPTERGQCLLSPTSGIRRKRLRWNRHNSPAERTESKRIGHKWKHKWHWTMKKRQFNYRV